MILIWKLKPYQDQLTSLRSIESEVFLELSRRSTMGMAIRWRCKVPDLSGECPELNPEKIEQTVSIRLAIVTLFSLCSSCFQSVVSEPTRLARHLFRNGNATNVRSCADMAMPWPWDTCFEHFIIFYSDSIDFRHGIIRMQTAASICSPKHESPFSRQSKSSYAHRRLSVFAANHKDLPEDDVKRLVRVRTLSRKSSSTVWSVIGMTSTNGLSGSGLSDLVIMASNLPELERCCMCLHIRDIRDGL
jgi:hypothetical protein